MIFELPEEIRDAYYGKGDLDYEETSIEEKIIAEEGVIEIDLS